MTDLSDVRTDSPRLDGFADGLRSRVSIAGRPVDRALLTARMAEMHVPGVSVAVLDDEAVVHSKAWGVGETALFQAASISKPVAAMAAVRLATDGLFDLDQEVNDLLRSWKLPDGDGVTVRRILAHAAGLGVHGFPGYPRGDALPTTVQILDGQTPANTEAVRVVRPPGEAFQYSGGGYTVLQLLLEDLTGEPFPVLMRRTLLDPLGMTASTYEHQLPAEAEAVAARAHDGEGIGVPGGWHVYPENAAASLWTTPSELLQVAAEMIEPGRVLDLASRDAMLSPPVEERYGLGWALEGAWFQHGGSNHGYRALLFGSAVHRGAAAVMTNGDGGLLLCGDLMATIAEEFGWPDFLQERSVVELTAGQMDEVSGVYELWPDMVLTVRRAGDALLGQGLGFPERELFAASPTHFFRTDVAAEITWSGDSVTIDVAGMQFIARRRA